MPHKATPDELALFKAIFDQVGDAIYIIDPVTSNIIDVNAAGAGDLGMTRDEVLEQSVLSLQKDVTGLPQWGDIVAAIRDAGTYVFVGRHQRKDGSEFPVEVHTRYFTHEDTAYLVSIARDISERVRLKTELQQREHIHRFALEEAIDGLWDWHVASGEVYFSPQWKRMMGFGPREVKPVVDTWIDMVHADDLEWVMAELKKHLHGRTVRYEAEYRLRNRNGDYLWVHDRGKVVEWTEDGEAARVVGMVQDISTRKELELRLREMARRDELTGLLNRRAGYEYFFKYLKLGLRRGQTLTVCLIDIDRFKPINDNYGHPVGDEVLKAVTERMLGELRDADVLCRWGGEEFLLLLPDTDVKDAVTVADKLRNAISATPIDTGEHALSVTVSIGISASPDHGDNIEALVAKADRALYAAKQGGRNRTEACCPKQAADE